MRQDRSLVAAAFSEMLGIEIVPDPEQAPYATKLSITAAHSFLIYIHDDSPSVEHDVLAEVMPPDARFSITITSITGETFEVEVNNVMRVYELKQLIEERVNISPNFQTLRCRNQSLSAKHLLGKYSLNSSSNIFVLPYHDGLKTVSSSQTIRESDIRENSRQTERLVLKPIKGFIKQRNPLVREQLSVDDFIPDIIHDAQKPKLISISIELSTREVINLSVNIKDSIEDIKLKLGEIKGLPPHQLNLLLYNRKSLKNRKTLQSYGIVNGSRLQCVLLLTGGGTLNVKRRNGDTFTIDFSSCDKIRDIKSKIMDKCDIHPKDQRLVIHNKDLYDLDPAPPIGSLIWLYTPNDPVVFFIDPCDLDQGYDFDFTNVDDTGKIFKRGGREYKRPVGWMRYALNVRGKYDNDNWLGVGDSEEVWPVSYHGTRNYFAGSIAREGYRLDKGLVFAYGKGIYSTPQLECADLNYSKKFEFSGREYKVVLQNRVNLLSSQTQIVGRYEYFITPNDKDIRPYGVLIKEIQT